MHIRHSMTVAMNQPSPLAPCQLDDAKEGTGTMRAVLEQSARQYGDLPAVQVGDVRLTYRDLCEQAGAIAGHLARQGITSNTPVVLLFHRTPASILCFLALGWLNARVIPLEPETAAHELGWIADDIPFAALVGEQPALLRLSQSGQRAYATLDAAALAMAARSATASISAAAATPDPVFLYHYTSGSTGKPKAALHTQANLINGGLIYRQTYQLRPGDTIFAAVPLAHSFGMVGGLIAALVSGARLVLAEQFLPNRIPVTLSAEGARVLLATPFIYDLLARSSLRELPDLRALQVCLSSGGPLSPQVAARFTERYHTPIYQVYGCTEAGAIAAQWPRSEAWPDRSIGSPLPGVHVRVVDEDNREVPPGEVGTLLVRTPAMFLGYHNHAEATAWALRDHWYSTGDMARRDESGHLYIEGRKDTFINVGGKKVNPYEVEEVLLAHPQVQEALVYKQDAGDAGEYVRAAVVPAGPVSADELIRFCRERLAAHKSPAQIDCVPALPKTSIGKVRRGAAAATHPPEER
jgi:long-chain acyl-CoA synthetase